MAIEISIEGMKEKFHQFIEFTSQIFFKEGEKFFTSLAGILAFFLTFGFISCEKNISTCEPIWLRTSLYILLEPFLHLSEKVNWIVLMFLAMMFWVFFIWGIVGVIRLLFKKIIQKKI
jgi:hypothetical protein